MGEGYPALRTKSAIRRSHRAGTSRSPILRSVAGNTFITPCALTRRLLISPRLNSSSSGNLKKREPSVAKQVAKNRVALICTGAAPGLTNLLAKRGAELLDSVESIQLRLFESTESKDPVSTWSPEGAYDEAISSPRIYRNGQFVLAKR